LIQLAALPKIHLLLYVRPSVPQIGIKIFGHGRPHPPPPETVFGEGLKDPTELGADGLLGLKDPTELGADGLLGLKDPPELGADGLLGLKDPTEFGADGLLGLKVPTELAELDAPTGLVVGLLVGLGLLINSLESSSSRSLL